MANVWKLTKCSVINVWKLTKCSAINVWKLTKCSVINFHATFDTLYVTSSGDQPVTKIVLIIYPQNIHCVFCFKYVTNWWSLRIAHFVNANLYNSCRLTQCAKKIGVFHVYHTRLSAPWLAWNTPYIYIYIYVCACVCACVVSYYLVIIRDHWNKPYFDIQYCCTRIILHASSYKNMAIPT